MKSIKGLMIINLGSPESTNVADVKAYLNEFLMDAKVIDYPYIFRKVLVQGIIVPRRAANSAHAYKSVWTDRGSPLKVITDDFKDTVGPLLNMPVEVAMRYGKPTPAHAIKSLLQQAEGLNEILVAPMYPHYAMSSYETALEHALVAIKATLPQAAIKVLKPFYNEPGYIKTLANHIEQHYANKGFDACLFSYHGLPIRHIKKGDPTHKHCFVNEECCTAPSAAWQFCYRHQVKETTKLVAQTMGLSSRETLISFQSRLGAEKWIPPYTDIVLQELPKQGVKKLAVVCPAFVADCLETLEEINMRGRELFLNSGGEQFEYIPCLNTTEQWVNTFAGYCNESDKGYWDWWKTVKQ